MKIAYVTESLYSYGGGFTYWENIKDIIGEHDIYTLLPNESMVFMDSVYFPLKSKIVIKLILESRLFRYWYEKFIYIFSFFWFQSIDMTKYDLVITAGASSCRGINSTYLQKRIDIIFTPNRFMWEKYSMQSIDTIFKYLKSLFNSLFLIFDYTSSHKADKTVSISRYIQDKVKKYYRRESLVIHPTVKDSWFDDQIEEFEYSYLGDFVILVSRLYEYKNVDKVINSLGNKPVNLVIVGSGPDEKRLKTITKKFTNIIMLGSIDNSRLRYLMSKARGFIFGSEEDFGLVMVESLALGTPVIAYGVGGSNDIVIDGYNGYLFEDYGEIYGLIGKLNVLSKIDILNSSQKFRWSNCVSRYKEVFD